MVEQQPTPRLEQTSAAARDKAVADARAAEQRAAQVRHENMVLRVMLRAALDGPLTDASIERARALLASPPA